MTPEKRPAEDEEEQEAKKLKEDSTSSVSEAIQDETSQDSVCSDSASSSDPEKKVGFVEAASCLTCCLLITLFHPPHPSLAITLTQSYS